MSGHVFPPSDTRQLYCQYRRGLISYSQYQDQLVDFNEYCRNYQQRREECNERMKTLMEIAFCFRVLACAMKMIQAKSAVAPRRCPVCCMEE